MKHFVVPGVWLREIYDKYYETGLNAAGEVEYNSLDEFLEVYEPETVGEFIYQAVLRITFWLKAFMW